MTTTEPTWSEVEAEMDSHRVTWRHLQRCIAAIDELLEAAGLPDDQAVAYVALMQKAALDSSGLFSVDDDAPAPSFPSMGFLQLVPPLGDA